MPTTELQPPNDSALEKMRRARELAALAPKPGVKSKPELEPEEAQVGLPSLNSMNKSPKDPVQMAREALRLKSGDPTPKPKLDPATQAALDEMDPEQRDMAIGVLGCIEEMKAKVANTIKRVSDHQAAAQAKAQNTSFSQKLLLRRDANGTMTEADVEKARGIIAGEAVNGHVDPVASGIAEMGSQNKELMAAVGEAKELIKDQIPPDNDAKAGAMNLVMDTMSQQAGGLNLEVNNFMGSYKKSDIVRLQEAVASREGVSQEHNKEARQEAKLVG